MSLDISVSHPDGRELEMNWLRNSYGLCSWAESNYAYATKSEPVEEQSLYYVINHWNYDKAPEVDRALFLAVVHRYGEVITTLEKGYFWFDVSAYIQFVEPHLDILPRHEPLAEKWGIKGARIEGAIHYDRQIGIPMDYFGHPAFELSDRYRPNAHTLERYQTWYGELVALAELLQDPETTFYCSN